MKLFSKAKALVFFQFFILSVFFVVLAHCGGAGGILTTAITGGSDTGGGTAGGNASVEAAGEAETEAFDSGPVDLPVTIAKLETPDVTKLVISAQSLDQSVNLPQNIRLLVTKPQYSVTDPTVAYAIVGSAGAVQSPTVTPFVYLENATNSTSEFCEVNSDGSFTCAILGDLLDNLRLYASTTNDTSTASMSPPLYINVDEFGVTAIADTNSANISADFSVITDGNGYYYLVVVVDGKSNFYRKNIDGSLLETIWTDSDPESVYIPTKIDAGSNSGDGNFVYFFDQNGLFYELNIQSTSSQSVVHQFLSGGRPAYTLTPTVNAIDIVNSNINPGDPADGGYRVKVVRDGGFFITVNVTYPKSVSRDGSATKVIHLGEEGIGDLFFSLPHYDFDKIEVDMNFHGIGLAKIQDVSRAGCEEECFAVTSTEANPEESDTPFLTFFSSTANLPSQVNQITISKVDSRFYYLVNDTAAYRFIDDGSEGILKKISDQFKPERIVESDDGTLQAGCCLNSSGVYGICTYNQNTNDFEMIWQEDGDLCDSDNPPEIDSGKNLHFYDALGQHRGVYTASNDQFLNSKFKMIPEVEMAYCELDINTEVTETNWSTFCSCWENDENATSGVSWSTVQDADSGVTCSELYNKCVTAEKTAKLHECFWYLMGTVYQDQSCSAAPWPEYCGNNQD